MVKPLRLMKSIIIILAALLPLAAQAQEHEDPCANAESTMEINDCMRGVFEQADAELNRVYRAVMASIDEADHVPADKRKEWKQQLREAQRDWVSFKEKDCEVVYYEWWLGSGANAAALGCLISKTETRTNDLKERYAIGA